MSHSKHSCNIDNWYYFWLQINILDVNDNCPTLSNGTMENYSFEPIPALQVDPSIHFRAEDVDSGDNARISYYVSEYAIVYV